MLPDHIECSICHERFLFPFRRAFYYIGSAPLEDQVSGDDLLEVLVQPAWCKECDILSLVEDIPPLREFEDVLGAVRARQKVDYPVHYCPPRKRRAPMSEQQAAFDRDTDNFLYESAVAAASTYLRWRMKRHHAPRMLCCGGTRFQRFDDPSCKVRHADCEFGFLLQPRTICGGHPMAQENVRPLNERLYSEEGELIGFLTLPIENPQTNERMWKVEPLRYQAAIED